MKRRGLVTLLSAVAAGWPLTARAQKQAILVIGNLPFSASAWHTNVQDGSRLTALG